VELWIITLLHIYPEYLPIKEFWKLVNIWWSYNIKKNKKKLSMLLFVHPVCLMCHSLTDSVQEQRSRQQWKLQQLWTESSSARHRWVVTAYGSPVESKRFITPPTIHRGQGIVFDRFLCFFIYLFQCSKITRKRPNQFAWNFQGKYGVTMGQPDYIFGQFRETARCRDAQHGGGVCCALAPQLV